MLAMQGDARVIEFLNEQLTAELTAINQYFLHARMQENWGYTTLASHTRAESIDEMRHAEVLTDRILFLEGLPNYQKLFPLRIGETVPEQFACDMLVEVEAVERLRRGAEYMRSVGDITSCKDLRGHPGRRGAPHRLPGDPDRADREAGRAALPAERDNTPGAGELTVPRGVALLQAHGIRLADRHLRPGLARMRGHRLLPGVVHDPGMWIFVVTGDRSRIMVLLLIATLAHGSTLRGRARPTPGTTRYTGNDAMV